MTPAAQLAVLEAAYLRARSTRDRVDVARVTGDPPDIAPLEADADLAMAAAQAALAPLPVGGSWADVLGEDDRRAVDAMRAGLDAAEGYALPGVPDDTADVQAPADGADGADTADTADEMPRVARRLDAAFAAAAGALPLGDESLSRRQVLLRLASEPDPSRRRSLFLALEPLWHAVDGDDGPGSPYRELIAHSVARWRAGDSPVAANALALGVTETAIEEWAVKTLAAWHASQVAPALKRGEPSVEPWDWWWLAGAAHRALSAALPPGVGPRVNRDVYASLGADPEKLGIRFDLTPRPGRAPVPVAFATFDGRPFQQGDGSWSTGRPTILATCTDGGLDELNELVHETGHAIHLAGIRTRPAYADWPDSDALTEAIAELVSLDLVEPAWQRRWLPGGPAVPLVVSIRSRYAEIAMDAAWALFEIRLHADTGRAPNEVWSEITAKWLGIAPHPEWSWWAMRGQLVEAPGYMANYAIGAVLAADMRAAIRDARGDWIDGDPGWYAWVSDHLLRFGLERSTRDVLHDLLGRPPTADALLAEIARGASS